MLYVELPQSLEHQLSALSQSSGISENVYVQKALEAYLEDIADTEKALQILKNNQRWVGIEEIEQRLGLED